MAKNNDQAKKNLTYQQADFKSKDSKKSSQDVKLQENAVNVNQDTIKSAMKDLQQKISDAKNSENKGEVIQNAVFEMMQNMGLKIPPNVIDKIKNTRGEK
jgi:predicted unusual protein kinase regulating ubiquinone biosynthesis (AarF/ABC1/UbiB family)